MDLRTWHLDARQVKESLDRISAQTGERETMLEQGRDAESATATLRSQLRIVGNQLRMLEDGLAALNSRRMGVSAQDIKECETLLSQLGRRHTIATNMLRGGAGGSRAPTSWASESAELFAPQARSTNPFDAASSSRLRSKEAMLAEQEGTMEAQDRDMEAIHGSVKGLLDIAKQINGELDAQDGMLNQMKQDLDKTHAGIQRTEQRTQEVTKKNKRCAVM